MIFFLELILAVVLPKIVCDAMLFNNQNASDDACWLGISPM